MSLFIGIADQITPETRADVFTHELFAIRTYRAIDPDSAGTARTGGSDERKIESPGDRFSKRRGLNVASAVVAANPFYDVASVPHIQDRVVTHFVHYRRASDLKAEKSSFILAAAWAISKHLRSA